MKNFFLSFVTLFLYCISSEAADLMELFGESKIVISTKRILLENYPGAHNPSILKVDQGYLLTFRYVPDPENGWLNYIGIVLLNNAFEPVSEPQLLNTRSKHSKTPSQSEDARIFVYKDRIFLIYNDNLDKVSPTTWERRDMYLAELCWERPHQFTLSSPLKLVYEEKYNTQFWQKNWIPFEWNDQLLFTYTLNPHEIIYPNLKNGSCYHCYDSYATLDWKLGTLRGSTTPQLVDGEYLAFFHSGAVLSSTASWGWDMWHYFMGAYTFSAEPPFQITKITPDPIVGEGFYTISNAEKRVIFPGGFVIADSFIHVAYGKDDREIWIATLDKGALYKALIPLTPN